MKKNITDQGHGISPSILGVPVSDLSGDASPATVPSWESFQHTRLIFGIEEAFGISFPEEGRLKDSLESISQLVVKGHG